MNFDNKVAIVTGSGSGIGRDTALLLAKHGALVVVSDVNDKGGKETLSMIEETGHKAVYKSCDVSNRAAVRELFAFVDKQVGKVDILVNNAGIAGELGFVHEYDEALYDRIQRVNQDGVFFCTKEALKRMIEDGKGGRIVTVSSLAGIGASPRMGPYSMSKHAVVGLMKAVASEYGKYNIRSNAVCPTIIDTPMGKGFVESDGPVTQMIKHMIPLRRFGHANEVAETIVWLCADESSYINGETIRVDGGMKA